MTERPELKSFGDLGDDEPWYDDTDDETFRPFDGRCRHARVTAAFTWSQRWHRSLTQRTSG